MKARVEIFNATHVVGADPHEFETSPACAESWCRWVLLDSVAYAARERPRTLAGNSRRTPLALPPMPSASSGSPPSLNKHVLSDAQKARVAENRRKALERSAVSGSSTSRSKRVLSEEQKAHVAESRRKALEKRGKRSRAAEAPSCPMMEEEDHEQEDAYFAGAGMDDPF